METTGQQSEDFSFKRRIKSFSFAFKGIFYMMKTQHNFWIQLIIGLLAVFLGLVLNISLFDWGLVVLSCGLVLTAETFNSAIESLADAVNPNHNSQIGLVKDLAAGAVLISAITAAIVGFIIFIPKIIVLI